MVQEAEDLREEGAELHAFLKTLHEPDWQRPTPFKNWTPFDVVAHLYMSDRMAAASVEGPEAFTREVGRIAEAVGGGKDLMAFTRESTGTRNPAELLERWHDHLRELCERLANEDPERRLRWGGPDMRVPTFTAARQMETWAHGQDVYDVLGVERENRDRIRNVAALGVRTFRWTFANRRREIPREVPYVRLEAPSGAIWEWNEPDPDNRVEGLAVDFCHVVTQTRNVADTGLTIVGDTPRKWMSIAQCFAGPPEDPPKPGERPGR